MTKEEFICCLNTIKPNSEQTAAIWIDWADEQERCDSCDHTLSKEQYATADMFLDEFASMFNNIVKKHGTDIAAKIISLADVSACPYPWEIMNAAEYLADGGDLDKIAEMEFEGVLEDGDYRLPRPALEEESEDKAPAMQM